MRIVGMVLILWAVWAPAGAQEQAAQDAEQVQQQQQLTQEQVQAAEARLSPAERLMHKAQVQRRLGEFAEAVRLLEAAYRTAPRPTYIYLIGETEQEAGHNKEAVAAYRRYLVLAPGAADQAVVKEQIETLLHQPQGSVVPVRLPRGGAPFREEGPPPPPSAGGPVGPGLAPAGVVARSAAAPVPLIGEGPRPFYKQWWFWTAIGAAAVVGTAIGLGVAYRPAEPSFTGGLGQ